MSINYNVMRQSLDSIIFKNHLCIYLYKSGKKYLKSAQNKIVCQILCTIYIACYNTYC